MPEWQPAESWSPLRAEHLDLWHLALRSQPEDWEVLDPKERQRAQRLQILAKRQQFVAARAGLRRILGRYTGHEPSALVFAYGPHGKPSLPACPELSFNLSHSYDQALVGLTHQRLLGVDVERRKPGRRFAGMARRYFSRQEAQAFLATAEELQPELFYRFWTLKEAYLKALGSGLSFASDRFCVRLSGEGAPRLQSTQMPGDLPGAWSFRELSLDPACAAAACWQGEALEARHFRLS